MRRLVQIDMEKYVPYRRLRVLVGDQGEKQHVTCWRELEFINRFEFFGWIESYLEWLDRSRSK